MLFRIRRLGLSFAVVNAWLLDVRSAWSWLLAWMILFRVRDIVLALHACAVYALAYSYPHTRSFRREVGLRAR